MRGKLIQNVERGVCYMEIDKDAGVAKKVGQDNRVVCLIMDTDKQLIVPVLLSESAPFVSPKRRFSGSADGI